MAITMNASTTLFLQSVLIGLSIAAPVGQIGVLAIQRSLQFGFAAGLATGLGAAVADAVYGAIGAFGVSVVVNTLVAQRTPLVVVGSLLLIGMAWRIARQAPVAARAEAPRAPLAALFAGTVALTLANPGTILSFLAVFSALSGRLAVASPAWMVAGVFVGSTLWWLLLAAGVSRLRRHVDARWQQRVNRASALLLAALALWQLALLPGPGAHTQASTAIHSGTTSTTASVDSTTAAVVSASSTR